MLTWPFTFSGSCLRLNFSTSAAGSVKVAVCDETGKPFPERSTSDMAPLFGDQLDAMVQWNEGADLSRFQERPIRLRLELLDADVFGFRLG